MLFGAAASERTWPRWPSPRCTLRETKLGLAADGHGRFVLKTKESRGAIGGELGCYCDFEGKRPFRQLGVDLNVLRPGQSMGQ